MHMYERKREILSGYDYVYYEHHLIGNWLLLWPTLKDIEQLRRRQFITCNFVT